MDNWLDRHVDALSASREVKIQIDALAVYQQTEEADITSVLSRLGLATSAGANREIVRSFRKQMIIAGAMASNLEGRA